MYKKRLPKLAIFGAGGLGKEMITLLQRRRAANIVCILDRGGYLSDDHGLDELAVLAHLQEKKSLNEFPGVRESSDTIDALISSKALSEVDALFFALPNLPNEFIPSIARSIANESSFQGVMVDALKRTPAMKEMSQLRSDFEKAGILCLSGCGATPGMLTSAASLAAQSFVKIEKVEITFGVGIANWQAYRATIREDIAHLSGYDTQLAEQLSDEDVDKLLEERKGILELVNMEHADDIMLEMLGICRADQVTVGGIVDTRNPQKPISTNVKISGITYEGKASTHTFILGDETTMAANVNGSVLGYMNAALHLQQTYGASGFLTAAEVMPKFMPTLIKEKSDSNSFQTTATTFN